MRLSHYLLIVRWLSVIFLGISGLYSFAHDKGEKVFHTEREAKRSELAVSPDGKFVLFTAGTKGLNLLDVTNGVIRAIPGEAGRTLDFPDWSSDGRQVVAVSAIHDGKDYHDMKIVLLDTVNWVSHTIAFGKGIKLFPFFSKDGKAVYYVKCEKQGSTPNRCGLFSIDIRTGEEEQMTIGEIHHISKGDDDGETVLFSALGRGQFSSRIQLDGIGQVEQIAPYLFEKSKKTITPFPVDQRNGFSSFYRLRRDKSGNLYFITNKYESGSLNSHFLLIKTNRTGKNPVELFRSPKWILFDIARETGEIFIADEQDHLRTIRRLSIRADH